MIVDVWSWKIAAGKQNEVWDLFKRLSQYDNSQELVLRSYMLNPINGERERVYLVVEFESLAAMEKYWASFWQDGWPKFKDEWDPSFVVEGGSTRYQYSSIE